jgi:hypothetical protein
VWPIETDKKGYDVRGLSCPLHHSCCSAGGSLSQYYDWEGPFFGVCVQPAEYSIYPSIPNSISPRDFYW